MCVCEYMGQAHAWMSGDSLWESIQSCSTLRVQVIEPRHGGKHPYSLSYLTDLYFNHPTETLNICIFILELYLYMPSIWKKIYIIIIEVKGHFSSVLDTTLLPTCPHPILFLHSSLSHFLGWNWLSLAFTFAHATVPFTSSQVNSFLLMIYWFSSLLHDIIRSIHILLCIYLHYHSESLFSC